MRFFVRFFGSKAVNEVKKDDFSFANCSLCGAERIRVYACGNLGDHVTPDRSRYCDGKNQERIVTNRMRRRLWNEGLSS